MFISSNSTYCISATGKDIAQEQFRLKMIENLTPVLQKCLELGYDQSAPVISQLAIVLNVSENIIQDWCQHQRWRLKREFAEEKAALAKC